MLQIKDTLVSLDIVERFFVCDLKSCLGECCLDGDAGAPISTQEFETIKQILPNLWPYLSPAAQKVIQQEGIAYIDQENDLVTQLVGGRDCVFTCYNQGGLCQCAIEKAFRDGKTNFLKPISCHLYPLRLKQIGGVTVVNLHRWKICKAAETLGRSLKIRVYQFLREPIIRRFGQDWYDELELVCNEYLKQFY